MWRHTPLRRRRYGRSGGTGGLRTALASSLSGHTHSLRRLPSAFDSFQCRHQVFTLQLPSPPSSYRRMPSDVRLVRVSVNMNRGSMIMMSGKFQWDGPNWPLGTL